MAVQEIPDGFFYRLIEQTVDIILVWDKDTQIGSYYISIHDKYSFEIGRDVDIYKIVSDTQADVYKANKYNYKSVSNAAPSPERPSSQKNDSLYQSVTIDGQAISRIICNNKVVWQKQVQSTNNNGWVQLWQGTLSLDDVSLAAYKIYGFRSGSIDIIKRADELIGSYESINGNTLIARFDHSGNQLLVSGFGQNPVTIYGKN
ncbi:hypothetical protein ACR9I2_05415 [Streptococcus dysgalactiae subsp. equisimilis]|uniref:hypothetical protein n=1 Tax=Streptococcus dysgalactiae TaxID=1334 RepID=UPI003FD80465